MSSSSLDDSPKKKKNNTFSSSTDDAQPPPPNQQNPNHLSLNYKPPISKPPQKPKSSSSDIDTKTEKDSSDFSSDDKRIIKQMVKNLNVLQPKAEKPNKQQSSDFSSTSEEQKLKEKQDSSWTRSSQVVVKSEYKDTEIEKAPLGVDQISLPQHSRNQKQHAQSNQPAVSDLRRGGQPNSLAIANKQLVLLPWRRNPNKPQQTKLSGVQIIKTPAASDFDFRSIERQSDRPDTKRQQKLSKKHGRSTAEVLLKPSDAAASQTSIHSKRSTHQDNHPSALRTLPQTPCMAIIDRQSHSISTIIARKQQGGQLMIVGDTYQTKEEIESHQSLDSLCSLMERQGPSNKRSKYNSQNTSFQNEMGLSPKSPLKKSNLNQVNLSVLQSRPQSFNIMINTDFDQRKPQVKKATTGRQGKVVVAKKIEFNQYMSLQNKLSAENQKQEVNRMFLNVGESSQPTIKKTGKIQDLQDLITQRPYSTIVATNDRPKSNCSSLKLLQE